MLKTLKGKIMTVVIMALMVVNFGISTFVYKTFYGELKNNIKSDMENIRKFSASTLKYGDIVINDDIKVKKRTVYEINSNYQCYSGLYDSNEKIIQDEGNILLESSIKKILKDSNKKASFIRFNTQNGLTATYVYPVYLNGQYDCSLILQKSYTEKYKSIRNTMKSIVCAQVILLAIIILLLNYFINRIISPLKRLMIEMKKYGRGEQTEEIKITSKDEIGQVAQTFNQMIEEKKKLENVSRDFFNNATHELKTPITSIYGYLQILNDEELDNMDEDFKKRAINRMMMECCKLRDLIQKLLEISRYEVRKKEVKSVIKLDEMINEICERMHDRSERFNKNFIINMQEASVYGIKEDIEHIILNLVDNALKYSKDDNIVISLKNKENGFLFEIKNKITEIPKNISDHLLDPFVKYNELDDNRENCITSSGLGLHLCNELAKKNKLEFNYQIENDVIIFQLSCWDVTKILI